MQPVAAPHRSLMPLRTLLLLLLAVAAALDGVAAVPAPDMQGAALQQPGSSSSSSTTALNGSGSSGCGGTQPASVRLALGDGENEMVVRWSTTLQTQEACVQLYAKEDAAVGTSGTSGSVARRRQALPQLTPSAAAMQVVCGGSTPFFEPATGAISQYLHTVLLQGLAPGRRYAHRCGSAAGGWSDWRAFRAKRSPAQVTADAPVRGPFRGKW